MIQLIINNPKDNLFNGSCSAITLPGVMGEFQLLQHHCNIMAQLKAGTVQINTDDGKKEISISGGFLSFENNSATVLAS